MAKSPLKIMNIMGAAADAKSKGKKPMPMDDDADDMPSSGKKSPKQVAAAKEQEKAKGKAPFKK